MPGYQVSSIGRVYSSKSGRCLSPKFNGRYVYITLCNSGRYRPFGVHRLVLLGFCGHPPNPDDHARHLDGNPQNNHIGNLAWGTAKDNAADMKRHNRHRNGSATHCKRGHEFNESNTTIRKNGTRLCATCATEYTRKRANENRTPAATPVTHCKWGHEFTDDNTYVSSRGGEELHGMQPPSATRVRRAEGIKKHLGYSALSSIFQCV